MGFVSAVTIFLFILIIWKTYKFFMQFNDVNDRVTQFATEIGIIKLYDMVMQSKIGNMIAAMNEWMDIFWNKPQVAKLYYKWVEMKDMFWESNLGLNIIKIYNKVLNWFALKLGGIRIDFDFNIGSDEPIPDVFNIADCDELDTKDPEDITEEDIFKDITDDDGNPILNSLLNPTFLRRLAIATAIQTSPSLARAIMRKLAPLIHRLATRTSTKVGVKVLKRAGVEVGESIGKAALKGIAKTTFKGGFKALAKSALNTTITIRPSPLILFEIASLVVDIIDPAEFGSLDAAISTKKNVANQIKWEYLDKNIPYPPRVGPIEKLIALGTFEKSVETTIAQLLKSEGIIDGIAERAAAKTFTSCDEFDAYITSEIEAIDMEDLGDKAIANMCSNNDGIVVADGRCRFKNPENACLKYAEISDAVAYSYTKRDCVMIVDGVKNICLEGKAGYDPETGYCTISKDFCLNKGGDWKSQGYKATDGVCSISEFQYIAELLYGTTFIRGIKVGLHKFSNWALPYVRDGVMSYSAPIYSQMASPCFHWFPRCVADIDGKCVCLNECDPGIYDTNDYVNYIRKHGERSPDGVCMQDDVDILPMYVWYDKWTTDPGKLICTKFELNNPNGPGGGTWKISKAPDNWKDCDINVMRGMTKLDTTTIISPEWAAAMARDPTKPAIYTKRDACVVHFDGGKYSIGREPGGTFSKEYPKEYCGSDTPTGMVVRGMKSWST